MTSPSVRRATRCARFFRKRARIKERAQEAFRRPVAVDEFDAGEDALQIGAGRLFKVASHHDEKMNGFDVRENFFLFTRDHDRGGRNAEKDCDAALLDILQADRRVKAF